ncbi:MAG: YbbR-like domain-containing protein [Fusicatenibacter sp.]|nr:CdaR family protein [Fusicatenibacter sp.]
MKQKLLNNLPLKIASVLIAIVIWYVVVSANDPIKQKYFEVPVKVTNEAYIAAGKKTYQIDEEYQSVLVYITGNRSVVDALKPSDITVTADLTQIVTMETNPVYVPLTVSCPGIKPENIRTETATIPIEIEDVDSAKFPITIDTGNTKPSKDYEIGRMQTNPENITVSGPASLIKKISSVVASVDVTDMSSSGTLRAELKIIDKNQDEMSESQISFLSFDGGSAQVDVNITLWKRQAGVKLKAEYQGTPYRGYQVTNVYTTPEEITVAGSEAALASLAASGNTITIPADKVSVDGAKEDFETTVDISDILPDTENMKISSSSSSSVTIHVTVLPNGSREFAVDVDQIETINLSPYLTVLYDQTQISVRIKASNMNLDNLNLSNIRASINLANMSSGDYEVPVEIELPDNYELVDEVKTTIHLKEKAVPTKAADTD